MKIGILGSGVVGQTIAARLTELGHEVMIGTHDVKKLMEKKESAAMTKQPFSEWSKNNPKVKVGTFSDAAGFGEMLVNATAGHASIEILKSAGESSLNEKILIDVSNPLDFSKGMPPTLFIKDTDSLGEQIQRNFPDVKVVKTFNSMNCRVMMYPNEVAGGDHTVFINGNNEEAKGKVKKLLEEIGWKDIMDIGDITASRGAEMILPLWLRIMMKLGTGSFNFKIVKNQ